MIQDNLDEQEEVERDKQDDFDNTSLITDSVMSEEERETEGHSKCRSMQEEIRNMMIAEGNKPDKEPRKEESVKRVSEKADDVSEEEWVLVVPDRTK